MGSMAFKPLILPCLLCFEVTGCGSGDDAPLKIRGSNLCEVAFLDADTTQFRVGEAVEACNRGGAAPPKPSPTPDPQRICDQRKFLSEGAAKCLATEKSFPSGIEQWTLHLSFDAALQRAVWNVVNVVSREDANNWAGQMLVLDAVGGAELNRLQIGVQSN